MRLSSFIERKIEREIESLNDHLPTTRLSLKEALQEDAPHFVTRGGKKSVIKKSELELLADLVPEPFHDKIILPIVLLRRIDLGAGIFSISGTKHTLFLVHKILGYVDLQWGNLYKWETRDRLARPQVQQLRRKIPSTSCLGITTGTG
ncbi:MAG: DUF61 family protein [Candidatus Thorarchaeota archaeon]|nr:DUF61 family protein [Candidatus Thorarchaeota archaeon]